MHVLCAACVLWCVYTVCVSECVCVKVEWGVRCKSPGQKHSEAFRNVSHFQAEGTAMTLQKQESEEFPRFPEGIWEACLSLPFEMSHTLQSSKTLQTVSTNQCVSPTRAEWGELGTNKQNFEVNGTKQVCEFTHLCGVRAGV